MSFFFTIKGCTVKKTVSCFVFLICISFGSIFYLNSMSNSNDNPEETGDSEIERAGSRSSSIFEESSDSDEEDEAFLRYFGSPNYGPCPVTYDESIFQRIHNGERRFPDNANLRGAPLSDLNLDGIVLIGVSFEGSDLSRTTVRNAILKRACFTYTILQETDFTDSDLTGADFKYNQFLTETKFNETKLGDAQFDEAEFEDVDFSKSDLTSTSFVKAKLVRVKFDETSLHETRFDRSLLILCIFVDIKEINAYFNHTRIEDCRFAKTTFNQTKFNDAFFFLGRHRAMIFWQCKFTEIDFTQASLRGVYFEDCYLPAGEIKEISELASELNITMEVPPESCRCIGLETLLSAQNVFFVDVKLITPKIKNKLEKLGATFLSADEARTKKHEEVAKKFLEILLALTKND